VRTQTHPLRIPLGAVAIEYRGYVGRKLDALIGQLARLRTSVAAGNRTVAQQRWLTAQCTWQQLGAAADSFGAASTAINGLANGLPGGVADPAFTGLHRIEYGLFGDESLSRVLGFVTKLADAVADLRAGLDKLEIDPAELPGSCHEMLEDALRDHLSGQDDYGSGMAYALTSADVLGTRALLDQLKPLLSAVESGRSVYDQSVAALDTLDVALNSSKVRGDWPDYRTLSKHQRQPIDGAIGAALEVLYLVPVVLEEVG
jgi:iron uptake system EfeUOB component EfeO/EfeM